MRSTRLLVTWMVVLAPILGMPLSVTETQPADAPQNAGTVKHAVGGRLSYLSIDGSVERSNTTTVSLDAGSALSMSTSAFEHEVETKRIEYAYENASDKQAFVKRELEKIENQTARLRQRQNKVIQKYNQGKLSGRLFLRKLALISADAKRVRVLAVAIQEYTEEASTNAARASDIKQELETFDGQVRGKIRSALNGDPDAPQRYSVRTSQGGVVLATIYEDEDGERRYMREVYLDNRQRNKNGVSPTDDSRTADDIENEISDRYDVPKTNIEQKPSGSNFFKYLLRPEAFLSDGYIYVYADKLSGDIVYEELNIPVKDDYRNDDPPNNTNQNRTLTITTWTTFPGGYMYVRLTHPSGDRRSGTISVDGKTVGTTGADEDLLMLQPSNGTTITGTSGNESVSITLGERKQQGAAGNPSNQRQQRQNSLTRPTRSGA